jgi:hypothetical protein
LPKASIRDKGSSPGTIRDLFKAARMGQNSPHHENASLDALFE